VTGGTNGDRIYGLEHDTIHTFDTTSGRWDQLSVGGGVPGLPPRFAHAAAVVGDQNFVVLGGLNPFGVSTSAQVLSQP